MNRRGFFGVAGGLAIAAGLKAPTAVAAKAVAPSVVTKVLADRGGILLISGNRVPSDGSAGYSAGCLFLSEGGAFVNEGSDRSSDFNLVSPR